MAPLKFRKSELYLQIDADAEAEVLDAYSDCLEFLKIDDVLLKHLPVIFHKLEIPPCFTSDIDECILWFYNMGNYGATSDSKNGRIVRLLLDQLTISSTHKGQYDVSDVIDIDKLIVFGNRLVKFRNNFTEIKSTWRLFVEASGHSVSDKELLRFELTLKELKLVKGFLQLDDISDSILIDMLGCGSTNAEGTVLDYNMSRKGPAVGIKGFAEILGQIGHFD